jgi:hypothetical protein
MYVNSVIVRAIEPDHPEMCRTELKALLGEIKITPQRPVKLSFKRLNGWVL